MAGPTLVTGATGFAGSHLVEHLLHSQPGREPHIAAWANPHGAPVASRDPNIAWSAVDLLDRDAVRDAIATLATIGCVPLRRRR